MIGPFQWVLRNARLHASDPARRSAAGFVRGLDDVPHRAQVKRWENGQVALTHGLVRRYEDVLDLPEGQLLRAIDLIAREDNPLMSLPAIPAPISADIVIEAMPLLERALEYEPMTGLDWDRLTTLLGSTPHVLVRKRDWETLIYRLSSETAVTTGLEYAHRWEASARMVSNHRTTDAVIEMIESALKDDDVQLYSDYATLLRFCPDRRGHDVLVDVIRNPPNPRALWASLSTITTLVRHDLVDFGTAVDLLPVVLDIVEDESAPVRTRRAAASLAERTDTSRTRRRTARAASPLTGDQRAAVHDLLSSSGLEPHQQRAILDRTLATLVADTPTDASDEMLATMIGMALREPHLDTRDTALAVLMLSPQGSALGDVLAADLTSAVEERDVYRATGDLSMLSWLTRPSSLEVLTDLTTGLVGAPELAPLAGAALGNCPEPVGPARAARDARLQTYAHGRICSRNAAGDRTPAGNAWGVAYALGMRGRFDLIEILLALPGAVGDPEWGTSLAWWTALPTTIRPQAPA